MIFRELIENVEQMKLKNQKQSDIILLLVLLLLIVLFDSSIVHGSSFKYNIHTILTHAHVTLK